MSIVKVHSVFCDGCSNWTAEVTGSQGGTRQARREAKAVGWVHRDGIDRCPQCRDKPVEGPCHFKTDAELEGPDSYRVSISELSSEN